MESWVRCFPLNNIELFWWADKLLDDLLNPIKLVLYSLLGKTYCSFVFSPRVWPHLYGMVLTCKAWPFWDFNWLRYSSVLFCSGQLDSHYLWHCTIPGISSQLSGPQEISISESDNSAPNSILAFFSLLDCPSLLRITSLLQVRNVKTMWGSPHILFLLTRIKFLDRCSMTVDSCLLYFVQVDSCLHQEGKLKTSYSVMDGRTLIS